LEGLLNVAAIQAALVDVAERHESLRTVYPEQDGTPYQEIRSAQGVRQRFTVEDVNEADLPEHLRAAAGYAIDLRRELPMRVWLFCHGPQRHTLMLVVHHIAADGWSMGPLAHDLARAYSVRCKGHSPNFPELAVQYADYALWQ